MPIPTFPEGLVLHPHQRCGQGPHELWVPGEAKDDFQEWQRFLIANGGEISQVEEFSAVAVKWQRCIADCRSGLGKLFGENPHKENIYFKIPAPVGKNGKTEKVGVMHRRAKEGLLVWMKDGDIAPEIERLRTIFGEEIETRVFAKACLASGHESNFLEKAKNLRSPQTHPTNNLITHKIDSVSEQRSLRIEEIENSLIVFLSRIKESAKHLPQHIKARLHSVTELMEYNRTNNSSKYLRSFQKNFSKDTQKSDAHLFYYIFSPPGSVGDASFNAHLRSISLPEDFSAQNDLDLALFLHELIHALQDTEARMNYSPDQYFLTYEPDTFVIDNEYEAWAVEIEVLNVLLNNGLKLKSVTPEGSKQKFGTSQWRQRRLDNLFLAANEYFSGESKNQKYPKNFAYSLFYSYIEGAKRVFIRGANGYKRCSSVDETIS